MEYRVMPVAIKGTGGGSVTLDAGAAATNTTLTLPNANGTVITSATYSTASAIGQVPFSTDGSTFAATQKIMQGTAVATTSGTSVSFTSIPSWVKRITVLFIGVSSTGTSGFVIQIGSGSTTTSGYLGGSFNAQAIAVSGSSNVYASSYVVYAPGNLNTENVYGSVNLANQGSNVWVESHTLANDLATRCNIGGGKVSLSGVLDRVVISTLNGTDTFDAGSINIMYE
jgi:hypothetical protein